MLTQLLRSARLGLRDTLLGSALRRVGVTSLGRRLYERRVLRRGAHEVTLLGNSFRFSVRSVSEIKRLDGMLAEQDFSGKIVNALEPGDVVYDIGANVGAVTLPTARIAHERQAVVHAFEPEPNNVRELRRNVEANKLSNVFVHDIALGECQGTMPLYLTGETGSGAHSLAQEHTASAQTVEVTVVSGSEFARSSSSPPDLVKIDVEGAEMLVLKGMADLFDRNQVRDLFIEIHPETLVALGFSSDEVQRWLEERKYRLVWSQPRGRQIHQHYRRDRRSG